MTPIEQINGIVECVNNHFDSDILNPLTLKSRKRKFAIPRQIAMYFMRKNVSCTIQYISNVFNKEHGTVIHAAKIIKDYIEFDYEIRDDVNIIEKDINLKVNFSLDKRDRVIRSINTLLNNQNLETLIELNKSLINEG